MAEAKPTFVRRPYTGSCHCGNVKYIVYLSLPAEPMDIQQFRKGSGLNIYKCNCNTCHKLGIFHLRLASAPDDFAVLSPLDFQAEGSKLVQYKTNSRKSNWWFCAGCGVHPFTINQETEVAEIEIPVKSLKDVNIETEETDEAKLVKTKVVRLQKEGFAEWPKGSKYFSLNAVTLNPGQEGLDLRKWHDNGWIAYVDSLDRKEDFALKPHRGGIY